MSRRQVLGTAGALAAAGVALLAARAGRPGAPRPVIAAGTTRHLETFTGGRTGEWWVPAGSQPGSRHPTVVLIHGGYWRPGYDRHLEDAVAADLAAHGFLCWNVDYAPSDQPWPTTLADVAAGYDHLRTGAFGDRVDPTRVGLLGHSAGGHLALWLASRRRLPVAAVGHPGPDWLTPSLVVAQAPIAQLTQGAHDGLGGGAVTALLGGSPEEVPERYAVADPARLLPTRVRTVLVHGADDDVVPLQQSQGYLAAAVAAGDSCRLVPVSGGHFAHLDPASPAWARAREALLAG